MTVHNRSVSFIPRSYHINNIEISHSSSVTDLGILMQCNLNFAPHISNIITKAAQRSAAFFRGFISRDLQLVRKVFTVFIRPILEYNTCIWSPTKIYLINKLENIQRHFTKRIKSLQNLSYTQRLQALHLEPLELRRLKFDLIEYFKIINNISPDLSANFKIYDQRSSSRMAPPILQKPRNVTDNILSLFFYRAIDCWNALPLTIKSSKSLPSFKRNLLQFDFSPFLKSNSTKL